MDNLDEQWKEAIENLLEDIMQDIRNFLRKVSPGEEWRRG